MSQFSNNLGDLSKSAIAGSTLFSTVGGGICTAVCVSAGSVVGPVGTFFGAAVSPIACGAICGAVGSSFGFIGECIAQKKKRDQQTTI